MQIWKREHNAQSPRDAIIDNKSNLGRIYQQTRGLCQCESTRRLNFSPLATNGIRFRPVFRVSGQWGTPRDRASSPCRTRLPLWNPADQEGANFPTCSVLGVGSITSRASQRTLVSLGAAKRIPISVRLSPKSACSEQAVAG